MPKKDSCPDCYSKSFRRWTETVPSYPGSDDPDKKNVVESATIYKCRRCPWKGRKEELVSTKKFSVKKMGKIMSRLRRRR